MNMYYPNDLFNDHYRLLEPLGRGGFAEVWKASNEHTGEIIAIKIFLKQDEEGCDLCKSEFEKTLELDHPHIFKPIAFGIYKKTPFITMPFLKNGSVQNEIGQMNADRVKAMSMQIVSALEYIHNLPTPIIHNDIKPDNILIDDSGFFLLSDFGISKTLLDKFTQTIAAHPSHETISRPSGIAPIAYRAPELFDFRGKQGQQPVKATDIWSFGATVCQVATAKAPFQGEGGLAQRIGMSNGQASLSDLLPEMEPEYHNNGVKDIVEQCLALNPWDRPTASKIFYRLNGVEEIVPPPPPPPPTPPPPPIPDPVVTKKIPSIVIAGLVFAMLIFFGVVAWLIFQPEKPSYVYYEGLAKASETIEGKTKWGYVDNNKRWIIVAEYDSSAHFSGGQALVWQGGRSFYIDVRGKEVVAQKPEPPTPQSEPRTIEPDPVIEKPETPPTPRLTDQRKQPKKAITPSFEFKKNAYALGEKVLLEDSSTPADSIVQWQWQVNGKSIAQTINASYVLEAPGEYAFRLCVNGATLCTQEKKITVAAPDFRNNKTLPPSAAERDRCASAAEEESEVQVTLSPKRAIELAQITVFSDRGGSVQIELHEVGGVIIGGVRKRVVQGVSPIMLDDLDPLLIAGKSYRLVIRPLSDLQNRKPKLVNVVSCQKQMGDGNLEVNSSSAILFDIKYRF